MGRVPRPFQLAGALPADRALKLQHAWATIDQSQAQSRQELRQVEEQLVAEKRELKVIGGIQIRMNWDIWREERKQQNVEWQQSELDGRELHKDHETGMKRIAETQAQESRLNKLVDSRERQRFKSDARSASREADRQHQQQQFKTCAEHSDMQKGIVARERAHSREVVANRREMAVKDRAAQAANMLQEKSQERESLYQERRLELAQAMRELQAEKERLLGNIQYSKRRCAESPISDRVRDLTTAQAQRCVPQPLQARN